MNRYLIVLLSLFVHFAQYAMIQNYDKSTGTFTSKEKDQVFNLIMLSDVRASRFDELKDFFTQNPDKINYVDSHGYTALHIACLLGKTEPVSFLLTRGAKLCIPDYDGDCPIHDVTTGDILELMLKKDKNLLQVKTKNGLTLLDKIDKEIARLFKCYGHPGADETREKRITFREHVCFLLNPEKQIVLWKEPQKQIVRWKKPHTLVKVCLEYIMRQKIRKLGEACLRSCQSLVFLSQGPRRVGKKQDWQVDYNLFLSENRDKFRLCH